MTRSKVLAVVTLAAALTMLADRMTLRTPSVSARGQATELPARVHTASVVTSPLFGTTRTVMITGDIAQALHAQSVYTIPGGFTLALTDMVIVNYNNVNCDTVIGNGPAYITSELRTPANGSSQYNFRTGLFFGSGQRIYLVTDERLPGDGACTPTFSIVGTLTKRSTTAAP